MWRTGRCLGAVWLGNLLCGWAIWGAGALVRVAGGREAVTSRQVRAVCESAGLSGPS